MVEDYFLRMTLSGMLATIITTIIDQILYRVHLKENDISTFVASVLLPNWEPLDKISSRIVGFFGHIMMGAGFGGYVWLVLLITGSDYLYIKSMSSGAFFWLIVHRAITAKFWVRQSANLSARAALIEIPEHLLLGLLTIWFSYRLI